MKLTRLGVCHAHQCVLVQDLKPKSMPVLVIMPDNNLSYGLRCDAVPPEAATKGKPRPEGEAVADERGIALGGGAVLVGAQSAAADEAPSAISPQGESLPSAAGGRHDAVWQHGFACGTAAAEAAFSRQSSLQRTAEPASADDHSAANAAEGDVENGLPIVVRSRQPVHERCCAVVFLLVVVCSLYSALGANILTWARKACSLSKRDFPAWVSGFATCPQVLLAKFDST